MNKAVGVCEPLSVGCLSVCRHNGRGCERALFCASHRLQRRPDYLPGKGIEGNVSSGVVRCGRTLAGVGIA
jgi:hypothetical protein